MVSSVKKKKTTKTSSKPKAVKKESAKKTQTKKEPKVLKEKKESKAGQKEKTVKNTKVVKTSAVKTSKATKESKETKINKADSSFNEPAKAVQHHVSILLNESMMPYKFEPYNPRTNEEYMSGGQLKHFRVILETWKKELMKEVDNTITEMKGAGASVLADPNDRATQEEAFNLELRTRDRERKLIRKIEEALQQIDDREYGYCESCGVEIGIRRLEARPTAVLCIDCKTLDEIRERNVQ